MRLPISCVRPALRLLATGVCATLVASCATQPGTTAHDRVPFDARPNGIALRPGDGAIFVTDDSTNSLLIAPDREHFAHYAALPAVAGQSAALSQVVFVPGDALLVARFGFGTAGGIFEVDGPDKTVQISGPDPTRRRLGLAAVAPGQVLSSWFVKNGNAPLQGGLSLITYDMQTHSATERDVLVGLVKPVGVAIFHDDVFITDQAANRLVKVNLSALLQSAQPLTADKAIAVAQVEAPDLLAVDGSGHLYTKCGKTGVCRFTANGDVTVLANDMTDARGVVFDETHTQMDVVDRAKSGDVKSDIRRFSTQSQ